MNKTEGRDRHPSGQTVLKRIEELGIMIASTQGQLEARPDAKINPQIREQIHSGFIFYGALGHVLSIYPAHVQSVIFESFRKAYEEAKEFSQGKYL